MHPSIAGYEKAFFVAKTNADWPDLIDKALQTGSKAQVARAATKLLEPKFGTRAIAEAWSSVLQS